MVEKNTHTSYGGGSGKVPNSFFNGARFVVSFRKSVDGATRFKQVPNCGGSKNANDSRDTHNLPKRMISLYEKFGFF